MTKNAKKRSLSEGDTVQKAQTASVNVQQPKNKKKKIENKAVPQNGQAAKGNKPEISKKVNKKEQQDKVVLTSPKKAQTPPAGKQELSVEQLKARIEEIQSRDVLTKSARRKLSVFKKKLGVAEGTFVPKEKGTQKEVGNKAAPNKTVKPPKAEAKPTKADKKQSGAQGNLLLLKKKAEEDSDDDDDDDEADEDESQLNTTKEESDDEMESNVDEEEDDDDDDEDEEEDDDDDDDDDEDDDDEEDDDEDEDEEDEDETVVSPKPQLKPNAKKEKEPANQEAKKKRYVLFVGNLPFTATEEDIKKHFLTKVSRVVDVRIPVGDANKKRGFAYVELANSIDYENGLSLHHTAINGRRINVQYSGNDKVGVAKNLKLNALRNAGKLAGSQNRNNKKFAAGKKGKQ